MTTCWAASSHPHTCGPERPAARGGAPALRVALGGRVALHPALAGPPSIMCPSQWHNAHALHRRGCRCRAQERLGGRRHAQRLAGDFHVRGDGTRAFYFTEVRGHARAHRARTSASGAACNAAAHLRVPCNSANTPRSACGPGPIKCGIQLADWRLRSYRKAARRCPHLRRQRPQTHASRDSLSGAYHCHRLVP